MHRVAPVLTTPPAAPMRRRLAYRAPLNRRYWLSGRAPRALVIDRIQ
jgi:hypothetical protein